MDARTIPGSKSPGTGHDAVKDRNTLGAVAAPAQAGYSLPEPQKNYGSNDAQGTMLDPPQATMPPLLALRAFEAAARHESFVAAAAELHVSAGAIAQQIRKLEDWLGHKLFRRLAQRVVLTEAARLALPELSTAFAALRLAAARLADSRPADGTAQAIRLAALPAIAQCWLAPRLARLRRDLPALEISLTAMDQPPDLTRQNFDAAILWAAGDSGGGSGGDHPDLDARLLARDAIAPVCSPAVSAGLKTQADLARATLLHDSVWRDDWRGWLDAAGLRAIDPYRGPAYSLYSLVLQAALDGAGVALGHYPLVAPALAAGRLVAPFGTWRPSPGAIRLHLPRRHAPAIAELAQWLARDAAADQPIPPPTPLPTAG